MDHCRRRLIASTLWGVSLAVTAGASRSAFSQTGAQQKTSAQFRLWSPYDTYNTLFISSWDPDHPTPLGSFKAEIRGGELSSSSPVSPTGSETTHGVAELTIFVTYNGREDPYKYNIQVLAKDTNDIPGWNRSGAVRYTVSGADGRPNWFYPGNING